MDASVGVSSPSQEQVGGRPVPTRRDTAQSLNIDYYFSREANGDSNGSTNSLSATAMSVSPSSSSQIRTPSSMNLGSLGEETEFNHSGHVPEVHLRDEGVMDPSGPSNRRIQVHQLASSSSSSLSLPSPGGGMSTSSSYSDHSLLQADTITSPTSVGGSSEGYPFGRDYQLQPSSKGPVHSPILDSPRFDEARTRASVISATSTIHDRRHSDRDERMSFASGTTSGPTTGGRYSPSATSPQATPRQSSSRSPETQATPSFSRLAFIAPPDVSRRSLEALETEMDAAGISAHGKHGQRRLRGGTEHPRGEYDADGIKSAPAWKTEFGERSSPRRREADDGSSSQESTIKGKGRSRNRQTLPAAASNAALVEALAATSDSPPLRANVKQTMSPGRSIDEHAGRRDSREVQLRSSDSRMLSPSPEPPPRTSRRGLDVRSGMSPDPSRSPSLGGSPSFGASSYVASSTVSPTSKSLPLPAIPSPLSMSPSQEAKPVLEQSSSVPPPRLVNSSTLTDLSTLLGQSIDEIALDSAAASGKAPLHLDVASSARDRAFYLRDAGPVTLSTLPTRNASLPASEYPSAASSSSMLPPPNPSKLISQPQRASSIDYAPPQPTYRPYNDVPSKPNAIRKASSILSLRSSNNHTPVPFASVASRPWPAAMLFGHIKTLKSAGDRAKGYANGINDLSRSESGLRQWCEAVRRAPAKHRPSLPPRSNYASLSVTSVNSPNLPSTLSQSSHSRQVSAQSEFPMRADAYTAREISIRHIDPANPPNALPPNLPFPQLQQAQSGGMRASPSTQSMSSLVGRRGFFSAIGRRGSGKKDKEASLGPPQPRRDIRSLAISPPQGSVSRLDGISGPRQTSVTAPQGPRGPRSSNASDHLASPTSTGLQRHFTNTEYAGRGSLDASLSRLSLGRDSFEEAGARKMSAPIMGSPLVSDKDVREMVEVLPLAEPAVLRRYLARHGDQMLAIGAYLEDEKQGTLT